MGVLNRYHYLCIRSQEEQKDRAFRIIFDRKFEQELQSTLIELRAEAYVDIKLNS